MYNIPTCLALKFITQNLKRIVTYKNVDWTTDNGEGPYFIKDVQDDGMTKF